MRKSVRLVIPSKNSGVQKWSLGREGLGIEVDFSLPAERVIRTLDQLIEWRGKPLAVRCDNGPEYVSAALTTWAELHDIRLEYIQPGKPQ